MALRASTALGGALLLAACSPSGQERGLSEEEINALGLRGNVSADAAPTPASIGLDPLTPEDIMAANIRPGCMLRVGGQPVLAAEQYKALVNRYGQRTELSVDGPVGATGGFFQNQEISVSIGRPYNRADPDQLPTGPARVRLNDRRQNTSTEVEADWSCGN